MQNFVTYYTTCFSKMAASIVNGTFCSNGNVEVYRNPQDALKMAHPGDKWVVSLHVPKDKATHDCINVRCINGFPKGYLCSLTWIDKFKESLAPERCHAYCGVTCVNGSCPNALANEYPEYGYTHVTCEECGFYKGCEDCCFFGNEEYCTHEIDKEVNHVSGT